MQCPNCNHIERDELWGDPATCPSCGAIYEKALAARKARAAQAAQHSQEQSPGRTAKLAAGVAAGIAGSIAQRAQNSAPEQGQIVINQPVVVTDISMPFSSMVIFMVKLALAAIPASIILGILTWGFFSIISLL